MLKYYIKTTEALKRLRADKDGVVSLEYVAVAAIVCALVVLIFNGTGTTSLNGVLTNGFAKISNSISGA